MYYDKLYLSEELKFMLTKTIEEDKSIRFCVKDLWVVGNHTVLKKIVYFVIKEEIVYWNNKIKIYISI